MAEISGICTVCRGLARPAFTCKLCGALCCSRCFNTELGLCSNCAAKAKR